MRGSSSWSTVGAVPPRSRPMSAIRKKNLNASGPEMVSLGRISTNGDEDVVEEDDRDNLENDVFAGTEQTHERRSKVLAKIRHHNQRTSDQQYDEKNSRSKLHFRPSSAPARSKAASTTYYAQNTNEHTRPSPASISIAYLRAAAEKKKARDRNFAQELLREESERKKKISVKIEQANKMMTSLGSFKSFGPAPDRDGFQVVKVIDPEGENRIISVETFLREFEQLAFVPLGHTMQQHKFSISNNARIKDATTSKVRVTSSLNGGNSSSRISPSSGSPSKTSRESANGLRPRTAKTRPADQLQVQEELRGVLEDTIMLTKTLQDQLHELKLKGWNVAPRS